MASEKFQYIGSFAKAKKVLKKHVYPTGKTFYCACDFKGHDVDTSKCGYIKQGNYKGTIDWEHVTPAHSFGQFFKEWREGDPKCVKKNGKKYKGRKCAAKNPKFKAMEADLHNLVPSLPELNRKRSNFQFAEIPGEKREWGKCDFEISDKKIEPRDEIKGDIARIMFYMEDKYGVKIISNKNKKLFEAWNKLDPVDEEEKRINCLKAKKQGNENRFVGKCG